MTTSTRAGRPPRVEAVGGGTFHVRVKGEPYSFRKGDDGRLRALGNPTRDENFAYARAQVEKAVTSGVA